MAIKIFIPQEFLRRPSTEFLIRDDDNNWGILLAVDGVGHAVREGRFGSEAITHMKYIEVEDVSE